MREIKFRAWDKISKEMRCDITGYLEQYIIFETGKDRHLTSLTLMQYTGIKDKNGAEIYEGDIVKTYKYGDTEKPPVVEEVGFRHGCFTFGNYNWHEFLSKFRIIEVIGNIYEDIEPLEVQA